MAGILTIQIKSVLNDKCVNFRKVEHFIKRNSNPIDLVVLPELFATNNCYENWVQDENGGEVIQFASEVAKKFGVNVVAGSVVRKKAGKIYNSSFALNRQGDVVAIYDKINLNNYFGNNEGETFTKGGSITVAEFDFARVGLALGFDIRFPSHFTSLIKENVDIIVLPAAWYVPEEVYVDANCLKVAQDMWQAICKTRAYDTGAYFVVANQVKQAFDNLYGLGNSMIISPTAQILANAYDKEVGVYASVDVGLVKYLRQVFPINQLS